MTFSVTSLLGDKVTHDVLVVVDETEEPLEVGRGSRRLCNHGNMGRCRRERWERDR